MIDIIKTDASVGEDSYGVYYPQDGFLSTGFSVKSEAQNARDRYDSLHPDAYVVRVKIARVK